MLKPRIPMPTTHIPITAPPRKETLKPWFRLFWAAAAVLPLALTAMLIPIKPARPEQIAPKTKDKATHKPRRGITPKMIATTTTNIANILYSRPKKAKAPSLIAADISLILSEPWPCLNT